MYTTLITAIELEKLLLKKNVVIIDCRFALADTESGRNDYLKAHIPEAQYAHLDDDLSGEIIKGQTGRHPFPTVDDFSKKLSNWGIDKMTQVIAYDQSHGGIAARLWGLLKWLGHEKVAVLDGGWKHWQTLKLPTTAELPKIEPKHFIAEVRAEFLVDVGFMETNLENPDITYIDSRTAERYRGEKEPIDPIAGHIPGAISAPFLDNLGPDGLFLSKKDLSKRFLTILKGQPKGQTIFYCGSGVTACHNLLAMEHIGLTSSKLYPGSWSEWIVSENRGVAKDV